MSDDRHGGDADRLTVLCIDDDPQISETIALRLREYNVVVLRAFHGMQGLWLATTSFPDLIICDMRMPQGEGPHIIERLRNNSATKAIPIIVLTGQRDDRIDTIARRFAVDRLLNKPIRFDDLRAAIGKLIPLRQTSDDGCDL